MLNAELIEKNKQTFIGFYNQYITPRIGQQLLGYLLSTDFFTAPLTRDGVLSEKGGLCQHAINTFKVMAKTFGGSFKNYTNYNATLENGSVRNATVNMSTIAIVSLLSWVDYVDFYTEDTKNVKSYDQMDIQAALAMNDNVKSDNKGQFVWKSETFYKIEDNGIPLGTGVKALMILAKNGVVLTDDEMLAIRWMNVVPQAGAEVAAYYNAMESSPLLVLAHTSSMQARYILDNEKIQKCN